MNNAVYYPLGAERQRSEGRRQQEQETQKKGDETMSKPKLKLTAANMTVGELIAKLEGEIVERQKTIALLRATCSEAAKGTRGRPRTYGSEVASHVGELIAEGKSHRWIAEAFGMPIGSVGNIAKRIGAKRTKGDRSGGKRVKGVVNTGRKHKRLP